MTGPIVCRNVGGDGLDFSVYSAMPEMQKRQICLDLLAEFGGELVNETVKGELHHACTLPLGGHTDRNSVTASINYRKLVFKCYVCGNSGGLLWWIAVNRHESVEASKAWLKTTSGLADGIELPQLLEILDSLFHPKSVDRTMPTFSERVLDQWTHWPIFHPYLTLPIAEGGRAIPTGNLERFRVGYCDHDPDWGYYQRIIIPLRWAGKLVGWQARRLDPDDLNPAKYLNSPDLPRDRILFGAEEALDGPEVVVVESPASVLRHTHHSPLVATLGASVSDSQLPLLHRYKRVVLWLDADQAGWDALTGTGKGRKHNMGLIEKLRPYVDTFVVESPWSGADPADLTEVEVQQLVADAVPASLWRRPNPAQLLPYPGIA